MTIKNVLVLALSFVVSACGGGGGGAPSSPTDPTSPPADLPGEIVQLESSLEIGQSTELILHVPGENVTNITWRQTAGSDLEFYAADSKVIGFTPTEAGSYTIDVDYMVDYLAGTSTNTISHTFDVGDSLSQLTVRLGHAVAEGNGVSLISYVSDELDGSQVDKSSWRWTQTQGPNVTFTELSTNGQGSVFFDAPVVDEDTILKFSLTGEIDGVTHADDIAILVEDSEISVPLSNAPFTNRIADVFLYNSNSPAGQRLVECVYSNSTEYDDCTFGESPLIAQVTTTPTVNDIMDRVVVSHRWMGDQFKKFLETYDTNDDFKNLLRATTAVVISYDVRPSFYSPTLGAIYLDPDDLWETPAQRDTINQAPDYRAGFGAELQFEMPWRYVKDNDYAYYYYPLRNRMSRTLDDSKYSFASLLYHELAHANDFFPSTRWLSYSNSTTIYDAVVEVYNAQQIESDFLQNNYPLDPYYASGGQNELTKLAQVRFQDPNLVTQQQIDYTMTDVANMFKTEGAPQFYSYSSTREDLAILFDGFMMHARYGVSRDVAVSDQDYSDIVWGQRDRIGESWIKPRVSFVASRVLPEFTSAATVVQNMAPPTALQDEKTWRDSVVIDDLTAFKNHKMLSEKNEPADSRLVPMDGVHRHIVPRIYSKESFKE
jgi:hypothetical protein